jgi:Domain of unknown function (DUF892)
VSEHSRLVEERLSAVGGRPSHLKDAALALGGLNWRFFSQAQSDTPLKLAAFVYAVLHLDIGGYELLKRTARRCGDARTEQLCERIASEKREMARHLSEEFDSAVEATLRLLRNRRQARRSWLSGDSRGSQESEVSFAGNLTRGACAGLVVTVPSSALMLIAHRRLPGHEQFELPPETITHELLRRAGDHRFRRGQRRKQAAGVTHFGFGAAAGSLYGALFGRAGGNALVGLSYGLAVWGVNYLGLMPASGLHEPATRDPWRRNLLILGANAVWGTALAFALRGMSPRRKRARTSTGDAAHRI